MERIVARKIIEDGEEIIELDLNKSWPKSNARYPSYMDEVDSLTSKPRKSKKDFICII